MPTKSEMATIRRVKEEAGTGFVKLEEGGTLYFVEGSEVTKEVFIRTSDMDHMLPDSSSVKCSKCARRSVAKDYRQQCNMPQPSGAICDGIFY